VSRAVHRGVLRAALLLVLLGGFGLLGACQSVSGQPASNPAVAGKAAELSPEAAAGRQLFVAKGCGACHRAPGIPEAQGTIATNLRGVGDPAAHPKIAGVLDNTPENMQRWLSNPSQVKPGTAMPNLSLTPDEVSRLTALLETFK
jgi:cytochrome c2